MRLAELPREKHAKLRRCWSSGGARTRRPKRRAAYPTAVQKALPSDNWTVESGIAFPLYRMAGTVPDYGKLLRLGIPGLHRELEQRIAGLRPGTEELRLLQHLQGAVRILENACRHYAGQAELQASLATDAAAKKQLQSLSQCLAGLSLHPPATFREALQLFWLYALVSGSWNYGRMDVYMGRFLARDLDARILSEVEALELLKSLWQLMNGYSNQFNNRVFIGGMGRENPEEADRFALLALRGEPDSAVESTATFAAIFVGQNPELMTRAITSLGEGRAFPPAVQRRCERPSGR